MVHASSYQAASVLHQILTWSAFPVQFLHRILGLLHVDFGKDFDLLLYLFWGSQFLVAVPLLTCASILWKSSSGRTEGFYRDCIPPTECKKRSTLKRIPYSTPRQKYTGFVVTSFWILEDTVTLCLWPNGSWGPGNLCWRKRSFNPGSVFSVEGTDVVWWCVVFTEFFEGAGLSTDSGRGTERCTCCLQRRRQMYAHLTLTPNTYGGVWDRAKSRILMGVPRKTWLTYGGGHDIQAASVDKRVGFPLVDEEGTGLPAWGSYEGNGGGVLGAARSEMLDPRSSRPGGGTGLGGEGELNK